jgi:hypothetical protein
MGAEFFALGGHPDQLDAAPVPRPSDWDGLWAPNFSPLEAIRISWRLHWQKWGLCRKRSRGRMSAEAQTAKALWVYSLYCALQPLTILWAWLAGAPKRGLSLRFTQRRAGLQCAYTHAAENGGWRECWRGPQLPLEHLRSRLGSLPDVTAVGEGLAAYCFRLIAHGSSAPVVLRGSGCTWRIHMRATGRADRAPRHLPGNGRCR